MSRTNLKVLMFGWEFPPYNSGGLGVACEGLAKALTKQNIKINFVLPKKLDYMSSFCRLIFADLPDIKNVFAVNSPLTPYVDSTSYNLLSLVDNNCKCLYSSNLIDEVFRYGEEAAKIAKKEDFDIIHAHDWLSFLAGIKAKKVSGKPLVTHIHATEFDRGGGNGVNNQVYEVERQGFLESDRIIAVSNFIKNKISNNYNINIDKINVIHNGLGQNNLTNSFKTKNKIGLNKNNKIILFLGRMTLQKGPEYFLQAAKKVLEKESQVRFIMAGSGDMQYRMIELSAELGISDKVLFPGFLHGKDLTDIYQAADLYIMPSVSEPFGLTPLEAIKNGTPVLISKQSGVSEVINHCLKVDFWDIDKMANQILAAIKYPELNKCLIENSGNEIKNITWDKSAEKCINIYKSLLV